MEAGDHSKTQEDDDGIVFEPFAGIQQAPQCLVSLQSLLQQRREAVLAIAQFFTLQDMLSFTSTSSQFRTLLSEICRLLKLSFGKQTGYLYNSDVSLRDALESRLCGELKCGKTMQTISITASKICEVIYTESVGSEALFYSLNEESICVWKIRPFTDSPEEVSRLQSISPVSAVSGYKGRIVAVNAYQLCMSSRYSQEGLELVEELETYAKVRQWDFGEVKKLLWVNGGKQVVAQGQNWVRVVDSRLEVVASVEWKWGINFVHVEDANLPLVAVYHGSTLSFYNYSRSLDRPLLEQPSPDLMALRTHRTREHSQWKDFIITLSSSYVLCINKQKQAIQRGVESMAICGDHLCALERVGAVVYIYYLSVQGETLPLQMRVSPSVSLLFPLQSKLFALRTVRDCMELLLFKYKSSARGALKLQLDISSVLSIDLCRQWLVIRCISTGGKRCTVLVNTENTVFESEQSDYNVELRRPAVTSVSAAEKQSKDDPHQKRVNKVGAANRR